MLEDWNEEVAARLTMLEFMVEVLMARELADQSEQTSELMLSELERLRDQFHTKNHDIDLNQATVRIMKRSAEMQDRFLEKAKVRADQIRRATESSIT